MSEDSQAFIREIEEEVRRDKLKKLWDKYGTLALGSIGAVVLLFGGVLWYTAYQKDRAQRAGSQYLEAVLKLEGDKKAEAVAALEQIVKEGTPAYTALAKLRVAAVKREAGETEQALALYTGVADDASADRLLRSFASLQIASLKVDSGSWTEVQNRLNDLADESSPWKQSARELLGLAAYKHQKWDEAKQAFASILGDEAAPQALKQRAQIALALVTREEPGAKIETPAKSGTATPVNGPAVPAKSVPSANGDVKSETAPSDLKKDKSAADGEVSTAGPGQTKTAPTPTSGAGATNDAEKQK